MIVALNQDMYEQNNGGNCGQWMSITNENTGNTVEAYVADECPSPGCGSGDLDMSPSLFAALNNGNMDDGVFPISWNFHPKN
jgi:expansin (peptidoglycan-binding protein)